MLTISIIWAIIVGLVFVFDYWLAATGRETISAATWLAERAHPTLIAGVLLAGIGFAYIAWEARQILPVFIILISTGHLITSEGAAAVTSRARWLGRVA